jgi:hypothetical protein
MAAIFAFRCKSCGEVHEGSPSFGYDTPWHYARLSEEEKKALAQISPDCCKITYEDQTDHFLRAVLEIPIHGIDEPFLWGVWVSVSERTFLRYSDTAEDPDGSDSYFGRVCNRLPYYPDTIGLRTNVRPRKGGLRPFLELHRSDQDHPLVHDLYSGITIRKAQEIAELITHDG